MEISKVIETLIESGASLLISNTYDGIKSIVKKSIDRTALITSEKELEDNLFEETRKTFKWAFDDLFKNHNENSDISSRYIHLDLLLEPRKEHTNSSQLNRKRSLKSILSNSKNNIVILGQPGSGKTTSIKYIVNSILKDSDSLNNAYIIPIVIRLRELNKSNSILNESQNGGIFEKLSMIFGLNFNIKYIIDKGNIKKKVLPINTTKTDDEKLSILLKSQIIPFILENQKILLILDGFDEIIDDKIKSLVISEIKELARSLDKVNFILTSRSADYKIILENTVVYEISELNTKQIEEFALKWFEDTNLAESFLKELYTKTPYKDFYTRPLLLTQLALIYSRTNEIPDKPKMIYQRIIELVLKDWNEQQGIKRKTKYSTFTVDRKREFLSNLAYNLTVKHNSRVFSKNELSVIYKEINNKFKELPVNEVSDVIEEIETHNGLIIKSGYDSYEFSHLTIQEFFVADYIVRTGNIFRFKYHDLIKIPNELAIAVALSSEPSIFLYDLLMDVVFKEEVNNDFFNKFFNRILLEKPDFENNAILVITLLSVYSRVYERMENLKKNSFLSLNDKNKLKRDEAYNSFLEQKIISFFGDKVIEKLEGYYEIDEEHSNISSTNIIKLKKQKTFTQQFGYYSFPKKLFWNKSMRL